MDFEDLLTAVGTKRATGSEITVVVWVVILLAGGVGLYCLYLGFNAPPTKETQALSLRLYGCGFCGFALLVWVLHRFINWLLDR
jgi:hypothetical protein